MRGARASLKDKKTSKPEEPEIIILEDDETAEPKGVKSKPKGAETAKLKDPKTARPKDAKTAKLRDAKITKLRDAKITKLKDAKITKAKAGKKKMPPHPTYAVMIKKSIIELKERSGSSKAAILKYILAYYKLGDNATKVNNQLRLALKRAVIKGELKQVKGVGASGSFRLGEKKAATPKTTKKPTAKKSAAKKPAAAKSPNKPKTPKKAAAANKPKAEKKAKSQGADRQEARGKVAKPKTPRKVKASKPKTAK